MDAQKESVDAMKEELQEWKSSVDKRLDAMQEESRAWMTSMDKRMSNVEKKLGVNQ